MAIVTSRIRAELWEKAAVVVFVLVAVTVTLGSGAMVQLLVRC